MLELFAITLEQLSHHRVPVAQEPQAMDFTNTVQRNRKIFRVMLGIVSGWAILASLVTWLFFPDLGDSNRSLALLVLFVVGVLSLLLVIKDKRGNMWLLALLTPYYLIAALMIFNTMLNAELDSSEFVFFVYFYEVLTPVPFFFFTLSAINWDPLPLSSLFLPLAYPSRYRLLSQLKKFSSSEGWDISGLIGYNHAAVAIGNWNGLEAKIISERIRYRVRRIRVLDQASISVAFNENFYSIYADMQGLRIYFPSENHVIFDEDKNPLEKKRITTALQSVFRSGLTYLERKSEIHTNGNHIIFVTSNKGIVENQKNIQGVLNWVTQIGETLISLELINNSANLEEMTNS